MRRLVVLFVGAVLVAASVSHAQEPARSGSASAGQAVNLNTATVPQLEALPGIGRATAERIVDYRQKNGAFKKAEDLMNVQGIGEKSFLKLKPLVSVGAGAQRADRSTP
jgi:competence protein ComEA